MADVIVVVYHVPRITSLLYVYVHLACPDVIEREKTDVIIISSD